MAKEIVSELPKEPKEEDPLPPPSPEPSSARILPRLASLLVHHADFVSITSCMCGLIALLLLPALAKTTYISENALIPGSASPKFSTQDAQFAGHITRELLALAYNSTDPFMAIQSFLVQHVREMGADFYLHAFDTMNFTFSTARFFSTSGQTLPKALDVCSLDAFHRSGRLGLNIVSIVRAPRGEGDEAIVLVTPFDGKHMFEEDALSLGLGLALFRLLSDAAWLAKDIIWLAADSQHGSHGAVAAWLKDYHEPAFEHLPKLMKVLTIDKQNHNCSVKALAASTLLEDVTINDFKRAGIIAAGIVITANRGTGKAIGDSLKVYAEGSNGQMPNLDLINVVNNVAVWRQGLQMHVDTTTRILEWGWLHITGQILEKVGKVMAWLDPAWKFGIPTPEYVYGAATLASSLFYQALGIPTGAHGAFRDYQVDAITLVMSPTMTLHGELVPAVSLRKFGRLLEGVVRSVNNLLEKFHQSFFLYFLTGPNKFVSVGVYMIPLLLLIITLPLKAAALYSQSMTLGMKPEISEIDVKADRKSVTIQSSLTKITKSNINSFDSTESFERWALALRIVCSFETWAFLVAIFPLFASYVALGSDVKLLLWIAFAVISLHLTTFIVATTGRDIISCANVLYLDIRTDWMAIKASTLGIATIGLGIMSLINFAAALVGAILLVPMCLSVYPLANLHRRKDLGWLLSAFFGPVFSMLCSLPVLLAAALIATSNSQKCYMITLWEWTESMWQWGSATYLYLFLVHLPCSVLCLYVLLCRER